MADHNLPLQWVMSLKYLGIKLTANVLDYMSLNLLPLLMLLKQKVQAWTKLPLSLIGRISLLKKKIVPVILYFLRHSPIGIPKYFFKKIDSIVTSFLWVPKSPRIGIKVLQEPEDQGGLAVPDWQKYYLAGQMVYARRWLLAYDGGAATVLEAAHLGSYESLRVALFRDTNSDLPLTLSMKATIRAWEASVKLSCPSYMGVSPSSPLWITPKLPHFYNMPDPVIWAIKGIKTLKDITSFGDLMSFPQIQTKHDLTNSHFFRYLQFPHAFQSQFREVRVESLPSALETLLSDEDLVKPLLVTYKEFFKKTPQAISKCREKWAVEVPEIQGEDWDDVWTQPFKHLVSARDRLTQFTFLHRSYYTLHRLANFFRTFSDECWRCYHMPVDAEHIFWKCPMIQFWSEITSCITELMVVPIPMTEGLFAWTCG